MSPATNTCRKCGEDKPPEAFAGDRPLCRMCQAAYRRSWYERNRERAKAQARKWDAENRDRANELKRRWDRANPERSVAAKKRYAQSDRARARARTNDAAWRAANPEKVALKAWRSNHRRRGLLAEDTIEYVVILRGDPCAYCGGPADHIDHIDPVARCEDNSPENLTAACRSCNQRKSAKSLVAFLLGT